MRRLPASRVLVLCLALGALRAGAQTPVTIPRVSDLTIAHTLHFGDVDRESVVRLVAVTPAGVRYRWSFIEVWSNGDTVKEFHDRFVSAADLDTASRWHQFYERGEPLEHPGYTAYTIGSALYDKLHNGTSGSFSLLSFGENDAASALSGLGIGGARPAVVRWRGTLTRVSPHDEPFPLLFNGRRVTVPALHLKADLTSRGEQWTPELWILAQRDQPLILKLLDAKRIFQVVRADVADSARGRLMDGVLTTKCRVEVAGIYFEFNSAALAPESDAAIASLSSTLKRHAEWSATIEGHTDSIGGAKSNQLLSERRAESVRARLVKEGIGAARLKAAGYGATRPREPNTTIEGRARNRRVELARDCNSNNGR